MYKRTYWVWLHLFCCFIGQFAVAQADSVAVTGRLLWTSETIAGFPSELKIVSEDKQEFVCPVDSTGKYACCLLPGRYNITPKLHYFWNGDDFVRINENRAVISIHVGSQKSYTSPVLVMDTIGSPVQVPAVGVAKHFTTGNARLLDRFVVKQMAYFEIPGASLAIIKDGRLLYNKVYGVANNATREPVTLKTLFEAGSVTKPVFAFVVMRLVEQNIINLDQPLYELFPYAALEHDERYKLITARHVLSHKSGLPNWGRLDSTGHFYMERSPGIKFGYSGEAYEYLKRVLEHVTGESISTILDEELVKPLRLENFHFKWDEAIKNYSARGHKELKPSPVRYIEQPMMGFSLFTEAKAFSKFMLALRNHEGLGKETYVKLFSVESAREDGVQWSLGFEINDGQGGRSYGHSGGTSSGFICNFRYFPQVDIGYVFFTNSEMGEELCIPLLTQFIVTGKSN